MTDDSLTKRKKKKKHSRVSQIFSHCALVSGVKTIAENMTQGEPWGYQAMKEKNEAGEGLSAIFGAHSNARGFTAADRKIIFAQEKKEKERQREVDAFQKRTKAFMQEHSERLKEIQNLPEKKRKIEYEKLASEFGYREGRSGTHDDARLLEWLSGKEE